MKKWVRVLIFGAAVAGLSALMVQTVFAHNHPVRFDPAPGEVLEAAPSEVTVWFVGPVRRDENWTYLRVVDGDGNRVDTGEVALSDDRRQMTVALEPDLEPGVYRVTWRNWDDEDGFILGDCYRFYVGQEAADAAITEGVRLFGGQGCESIGVSGRDGTPTPAQLTPTPAPDPDAPADTDSDDGSDGVPAWTLAVGVIGGLVVGGAGVKYLGSRG
jgi:methionine-rich copper-binding protein CopC